MGWCEQSLGLLARARILQNQVLVELPEISDQALTEKIPQWLSPFLTCDSKLDQLPWLQALNFYFGSDKISIIQKMIPEKIILPSGRSVNIEINHHNSIDFLLFFFLLQ